MLTASPRPSPVTPTMSVADANTPSLVDQIRAMDFATAGANCLVAVVTAAIVFNIVDFTNLRDKLKSGVSWRGAMLVGFVCGYLNERVLRALQTLLGS